MKIHEYQAKQILARYGVPVPEGRVFDNPTDVLYFAHELDAPVVVKAQVHVGGRGKAGGVKVVDNAGAAEDAASAILGMEIKGLTVEKVLVERAVEIDQEYYIGITLDRAAQKNVVIVSTAGGVDIEDVAAETPEKIARLHIDPILGLMDFQIRQVCYDAGIPRELVSGVTRFVKALYNTYIDTDALLAEINPLVVTRQGDLVAADAKIDIDDNAVYRHPEFESYREESEEDPIEAEARRRGIQYVRLDGDIGVIGNGAGLVMATLDEVSRAGGKPADFLDIGGGAQAELVRSCVEIVLMDPKVKGILLNIFGGITRCDEVARGILEATGAMDIDMPIVVRLAGTRSEAGLDLLRGSKIIPTGTMQEAAVRIVELTR